MDRAEKHERFKALHAGAGAFVMPNPWDAGTARLLSSMGFAALATTSAGLAFGLGRCDGQGALSRDEVLENARRIAGAVEVPVSADLENGYGATPEAVEETMRLAAEVGLVGASVEDASGDAARPIYDFEEAVARVRAAVDGAKGRHLMITARAENYLWGRPDLDDTIRRLQAFGEAGADVLYAPGLPDLQAIATVVRAVDKPVNVVMGLRPPFYSVAELAAVGVRRISVGGSFARAAFGAVRDAAQEVLGAGTFGYSERAMPGAEIAAVMKGDG